MAMRTLVAAWTVALCWTASPADAKPKIKSADESAAGGQAGAAALTELKRVVDHTAADVDAFVRDVRLAGDDPARLTEIGRRFQGQMQGTEVAMEKLQKAMDAQQRAVGEAYGRDKLASRMTAMEAAMELVARAVEDAESGATPETGPGAESFRTAIAKLVTEAEALQDTARRAGTDPAKREAVRQKVALLGARRNAAYAAANVPEAVTNPQRLFRDAQRQLEPKLQRVDRLLRLGLLPACAEFDEAEATVLEMAADARRLVEELPKVSDVAGLEAIEAKFGQAIAELDQLPWQKLAADERLELAALVGETVTPATEQFMERADALRQKWAPGGEP